MIILRKNTEFIFSSRPVRTSGVKSFLSKGTIVSGYCNINDGNAQNKPIYLCAYSMIPPELSFRREFLEEFVKA